MSVIEWIAALLGVANVWLVIRRSIWNFPAALAMCTLYLWVFFDAKLYSDALLQLFFIAINIFGWTAWLGNRAAMGDIIVETMARRQRLLVIAATIVAWFGWSSLMGAVTDASHPYWDGGVAVASISAQILLALRKLENWVGWIFVNLISVPLYLVKGLYPTAALYTLLLVMAVLGLIEWVRLSQEQQRQ